MKRRLLSTLLLILVNIATASGAMKLREYENRVRRAVEQVERIKTDQNEYGDQGVDTIKALLPESEQIEIEDQAEPFQADNTWLFVMLDQYRLEDDPQQKLAKLNEIAGRLSALDLHLLQVEEPKAARPEAVDSRSRIKEILSRSDYQARQESRLGGFIKRAWKRVSDFLSELYQAFVRLLANLLGATSGGGWVSKLLVIAALAVAAMGVARIAMRIKPRRRRAKKRTVLGEEIEAGTSPSDLAQAAMAAAGAGDFRTGMRKLYLSLLYELAERNLIEIEESATNHEYLSKVARFASLAPAMRYLTERFDYFWYGMLPSTEEDFSAYLMRYREAIEQARGLGEPAS
jgi:hypothetical protein